MKKILLVTSALLSVSLTGAALAQDISISGYGEYHYNSWSDKFSDVIAGDIDNRTANSNNNTSTKFDSAVTIKASFVSDSGLTYMASQTLLTAGPAATISDGMDLSITGDWGSVGFSDGDGMGDDMETRADVAADEATSATGVAFNADSYIKPRGAGSSSGSMAYKSPSIGGFQFVVGMGNAGSTSTANTTAYGASYSGKAGQDGGFTYTVKYSAANTGKSGIVSTADNGSGKKSATSMGAVLGMGNVSLILAQNNLTVNDAAGKATATYKGRGMGLKYAATDSLALALHDLKGTDGKNKNYKYNETAMSGTYTIAPGLTTSLTYTSWEHVPSTATTAALVTSSKQSGNYTRLEVKVAF